MTSYIIRRLLLMIPTLFAIMVVNFVVVQAAPGGPVEQVIAQLQGRNVDATARITGAGSETGTDQKRQDAAVSTGESRYRGAQGLDPALIADLEKLYGFDKPPLERFLQMMSSYLRFDFGQSFFRDQKVVDLVLDKIRKNIAEVEKGGRKVAPGAELNEVLRKASQGTRHRHRHRYTD